MDDAQEFHVQIQTMFMIQSLVHAIVGHLLYGWEDVVNMFKAVDQTNIGVENVSATTVLPELMEFV